MIRPDLEVEPDPNARHITLPPHQYRWELFLAFLLGLWLGWCRSWTVTEPSPTYSGVL